MKAATCHRCGVKVYVGPDDDVAAFEAVVDTTPLTITGEALAVISGRVTYAVDIPSRRNARRIWRRYAHRIGKADPMFATLHAAHVCNSPIPSAWIAAPTTVTATARTDYERCPF